MPPEVVDLNDYQVPNWPTTIAGEDRQADEIVRHYRTLLSHPSVQAITYWGFTDGGWLGAPGGLLRADDTVKPSYEALRSLIRKDWWLAPTKTATDSTGRLRFTGFLGAYDVSALGRTATLSLEEPGDVVVEVDLS